MGSQFQELTDQDTIKAERLFRTLMTLRDYNDSFSSNYTLALLLVGLKPGLGASQYASDLRLATAVTSRILLEIGKKSRHGGEGYGLVDSVPSVEDLRAHHNFLTDKGRSLLDNILRASGPK